MQKVSYSQFGEDIILASLLNDPVNGFYVDVGANYETEDSVTKYFYDKGWSGVNIEPVPKLFRVLNEKRKRDTNLNLGISNSGKELTFYEHATHGHSSFLDQGDDAQAYKVKTMRLEDVFKKYKIKSIDFLKVDVEGFEYEVIASNDWSKYRPKVLCIEANHIDKDWRPILDKHKYKMFIKDGLNEYYVSEENWAEITNDYSERAVAINASFIRKSDYDNLISIQQKNNRDIKTIEGLNLSNNKQAAHINRLERDIEGLVDSSYLNKSLKQRLIISINSLVDWIKSKR